MRTMSYDTKRRLRHLRKIEMTMRFESVMRREWGDGDGGLMGMRAAAATYAAVAFIIATGFIASRSTLGSALHTALAQILCVCAGAAIVWSATFTIWPSRMGRMKKIDALLSSYEPLDVSAYKCLQHSFAEHGGKVGKKGLDESEVSALWQWLRRERKAIEPHASGPVVTRTTQEESVVACRVWRFIDREV